MHPPQSSEKVYINVVIVQVNFIFIISLSPIQNVLTYCVIRDKYIDNDNIIKKKENEIFLAIDFMNEILSPMRQGKSKLLCPSETEDELTSRHPQ